jgi:hypothetical protein
LFNRFPNKSSCIAYLVDKGRDESDSPTRWSYVLSTHVRHIEIIGLALCHFFCRVVSPPSYSCCGTGIDRILDARRFEPALSYHFWLWNQIAVSLIPHIVQENGWTSKNE